MGRTLAGAFALALLIASPVLAAIGTPTVILSAAPGAASPATSGVTLTTTGDSGPNGNVIVMLFNFNTSVTTLTVGPDSAGNTYTVQPRYAANADGSLWEATCTTGGGCLHLPVGGTIPISWNAGVSTYYVAGAASISGLAASPLDSTAAGVAGTGTSTSTATGTLAQANEIVLGFTITADDPGAWNETTDGFTALTQIGTGSGNHRLNWAYKIVNATTAVTYSPAWTTSRLYEATGFSFKGAATPSGPPSGSLGLLGVGR